MRSCLQWWRMYSTSWDQRVVAHGFQPRSLGVPPYIPPRSPPAGQVPQLVRQLEEWVREGKATRLPVNYHPKNANVVNIPVHGVPKSTGTSSTSDSTEVRIITDFSKWNKILDAPYFRMEGLSDLRAVVTKEFRWATRLDIADAFNNVPLSN